MGKVKLDKVIHPRSRRAEQLGAQQAHQERVSRNKLARSKADGPIKARLRWFHEKLKEKQPEKLALVGQETSTPQLLQKAKYSESEVHALIKEFIADRKDNFEQKHNTGSTRASLLQDADKKEYGDAGLMLPDITKTKVLNDFLSQYNPDTQTQITEREAAAKFEMRRFKRPADETLAGAWQQVQEQTTGASAASTASSAKSSKKKQGKSAAAASDTMEDE